MEPSFMFTSAMSLTEAGWAYIPAILRAAVLLLLWPSFLAAAPLFSNEEDLDLHCLREAYPEIKSLEADGCSRKWLVLADGRKLIYSAMDEPGVREAMAQPYPLEPGRPDTPTGFAPGRKRPYALFEAIYGADKGEVSANLRKVALNGKFVSVNHRLAGPLTAVNQELARLDDPSLKRYLPPDGGFYWRKIAGEDKLSAHSYGIAVDIGSRHAPYWRWSRKMPHPAQKTYPPEIVAAFEKQGFIWGGKWHEYDLMHFEYRPELICKARLLESRKKGVRLDPLQKTGARASHADARQ